MFTVLSIVALFSSAPSYASACGQVEQTNVDTTIARYEAGVATRSEVALVKLQLNDAKKLCGTIDDLTYCELAIGNAAILILGLEAEASVGQRTHAEVTEAKLAQAKYLALCK